MVFIIIILGIILDRLSKLWALKALKASEDIVIIKDMFSFSYVENRGAAFGIFQNKTVFLAIFTLLIIIGMIIFLLKYPPKSNILKFSIALVISGAIGNLIDRIYYKFVVDFIMLHYKDIYYFPNFNIADMLVVSGTILLGICIVKDVD